MAPREWGLEFFGRIAQDLELALSGQKSVFEWTFSMECLNRGLECIKKIIVNLKALAPFYGKIFGNY